MKVCYIHWKDAAYEVADLIPLREEGKRLSELQEIGWLIGEDKDSVTIAMETTGDAEVTPGRWRITIPRVNIVEMRVVELEKIWPPPKKERKPRKAKASVASQQESSLPQL